jgi:hypothetical protein
MRGVIDTAYHWSAVSLTSSSTVYLLQFFLQNLHNWAVGEDVRKNRLVSSVIDTADHKIGDFKVEFLGEYESILKKGSTRGSVSQEELFDEKNQVSKISWHSPFRNFVGLPASSVQILIFSAIQNIRF